MLASAQISLIICGALVALALLREIVRCCKG